MDVHNQVALLQVAILQQQEIEVEYEEIQEILDLSMVVCTRKIGIRSLP